MKKRNLPAKSAQPNKTAKVEIQPLPKDIEAHIDGSFLFNKFGIVNLSVLVATTNTDLSNEELKKRIMNRFGSEMVNGEIEFLEKQ